MTRISLRDVGPRDGLQAASAFLPTEKKIEWFRLAAAAGVPDIEVTSFSSPRLLPQCADAPEVLPAAMAMGGFGVSALIPNRKGAERGFALKAPKLNYVVSASNAHSLSNVGRSTADAVGEFGEIVRLRDHLGVTTELSVGIATSFGCSIAGRVPESDVLRIAEELLSLGAQEISLADTVGYANPRQVARLVKAVMGLAGDVPLLCHFHDTRGLGLANAAAAIDQGVTRLDASLGGLGGCPFAPGATGNINLEDTVFLVHEMGFETGIDLEALIDVRRSVQSWLPGESFTGAVAKAGLPLRKAA